MSGSDFRGLGVLVVCGFIGIVYAAYRLACLLWWAAFHLRIEALK